MVCAPAVRVMPSLYVVFEEESSSSVKINKNKSKEGGEKGEGKGERIGRGSRGEYRYGSKIGEHHLQ